MAKIQFLFYFTLMHCLILVHVALADPNLSTDQTALLALKAQLDWSYLQRTPPTRHDLESSFHGAYRHSSTLNLSFLSLLNFTNNSFHGTLPSELTNLRRLKYFSLRNNNFNIKIPSWIGFLTGLEYLFLNGNSLIGSIPPAICNISSLLVLDLSFNKLQGTIPDNIFNTSSLRLFDLGNNELSGPMPSSISSISSMLDIDVQSNTLSGSLPANFFKYFPNLEGIFLSYNNFEGQVPSSLFDCKQLQILSLSANNFSGTIPQEIGNLTMLQGLYLGQNNFKGVIPEEIANLQDLVVLSLPSNRLTGSVPVNVFNMSNLQVISLTLNQLTGNLPSNLGLTLPNLQQLFLGGNMFTGPIPSSITNASYLAVLDLAMNSFYSLIPSNFGDLRFLQWLNLGVNNLTASSPDLSFITSLASCKNLIKLVLSGNPLNGILPASIGNLSTSLNEFSFAQCNITGKIPMEIGQLSNLAVLRLQTNELTGPIPSSITNLKNLQGLYINQNKLQGLLPAGLCNFQSLVELYLDSNELEGLLPECLGKLTSLRALSLGFNRFSSILPSSLWSLENILSINFSSNAFNGSVPSEMGNLKVVTLIDLSWNQLSGGIPNTIGNLRDLSNFSLAGNRLEGSIPQSLGNLRSLEFLDLSSNNLTGSIPKSLEALVYLRYLNLSFNRLEGEIPTGGPFSNFSAKSFVSNDALCGPPRLGVPPCRTSTGQHRRTRARFLILVIALPVILVLVLVLSVVILCARRQKRKPEEIKQEDSLPLAAWRRISYHELKRATEEYAESNLLGNGSFGSVYRGVLQDGATVAVKVFNLQNEGAFTSFDAESEILCNVRHRNLVRIISSCSNNDFKALVLDYMPNGSLEKWLHSDNCFLDLAQRLNIMIDVASALEYLHHGYSTTIVHCDIKPSNVLLDEDMVAHLSDFGIAKLLGDGKSLTQTRTLATIGYMAPEYGREGKVSRKGDVYSYGILLMETFTGRKPTDDRFSEEVNLKKWIIDSLQSSSVTNVADTNLAHKGDVNLEKEEECLTSIFYLAIKCCSDSPQKRIDIREVTARMIKIRAQLLAK